MKNGNRNLWMRVTGERKRILLGALLLFVLFAIPVLAQVGGGFDNSWFAVGGGGGTTSTGGTYSNSGTINQPGVGAPMSGGVYTNTGGLLGGNLGTPGPTNTPLPSYTPTPTSTSTPTSTPTPFGSCSINYPDFSSISGLTLTGDAVQAGSVLRLTMSNTNQLGSAWYNNTVNVYNGFNTNFQFQLGDFVGGGADGFSFNIQDHGTCIIVGERGTLENLSVQFDTFQNPGEPSGNFVRINYLNNAVATTDLTPLGINLKDGAAHTVNINSNGTNLQVSIDSTAVVTATGGLDLASLSPATVGFGARTGGLSERHDILNWSFTCTGGSTPTATTTPPTATNTRTSTPTSTGTLLTATYTNTSIGTPTRTNTPIGTDTPYPACPTFTPTNTPTNAPTNTPTPIYLTNTYYNYTHITFPAPPGVITSTIVVPHSLYPMAQYSIIGVELVGLDMTDTQPARIAVNLTSPMSTTISLFGGICGYDPWPDGSTGFGLVDSAPIIIGIVCPPGQATYKPQNCAGGTQNCLARFIGEPDQGTWRLTMAVGIGKGGGIGGLNSWGLRITTMCAGIDCGPPLPTPNVVGHVMWPGSSGTPTARQQQPITMTLCSGSTPLTYTATTDSSGVFSTTANLSSGVYTYTWAVKGARAMANRGVVRHEDNTTIHIEMGAMRGGDTDGNNNVNAADFNRLKSQFNVCTSNCSSDFNNDGVVNSQDFNILKANFGQSGATMTCP